MNFDLPDETESFRAVVRDFAETVIEPQAEASNRERRLPLDVVLQMGELGLFGLPFPEEYGGSDAPFITLCVALEEIARIDQSLAVTLEAGVGLGANPIHRFGTDEQKERWLPDLVAGRALGGFGLTEPEAGSDAGGTRTRAVADGDSWVIDGEKAFITNSGTEITSLNTITARTDPAGAGERPEITTFIVPADTPGMEVSPPYEKLGWHASDTHGLAFGGCRVPDENRLGERGRGFSNFLSILDDGRIGIAAMAVGVIQACLDAAVQYANDRNAFGRPIGSYQAIAFKCSDLAVMAQTARQLTYHAAWLKDQGRPFAKEAAMAKLHATEAAVTATREATQIFGGYGFMEENPIARHYRDSKILEIGEGTSEIQRLVIARQLGLPQ